MHQDKYLAWSNPTLGFKHVLGFSGQTQPTISRMLRLRLSKVCSMIAKANPYDNACAQSFFHSMKAELIHGESFDTREIMRQAVF